MLNPESRIAKKLKSKRIVLMITNICNLTCGGCHQLCGHFSKKKLWYLPAQEIDSIINLIKPYNKLIQIFGGEPTIHPEWDEIVKILLSHSDVNFKVSTNGLKGHKPKDKLKNIDFMVDVKGESKEDDEKRYFLPTLVAPIDLDNQPPEHYWKKAQKDCPVWEKCGSCIYKNKAYFCEIAAAMDHLFHNGENGWDIESDKNPMARTAEEINEQAKKFCYRCGWCLDKDINRQKITEPSCITKTNQFESPRENLLKLIDPKDILK